MSDEATPRPSARAVERLADDVGSEVGDLRERLHRALDEADRLQAAGHPDLAAALLDEQRGALLAVHGRLQERLADAAVEREAERVLGAASVDPAPAADGEPVAPTPVAGAGDGGTGVLRLLASAVAAVLGVALLVTPEVTGGGVTAAGTATERGPDQDEVDPPARQPQEEPEAASPRTGPDRSDAGGGSTVRLGPPVAAGADGDGAATSPSEGVTEPAPAPHPAPWLAELAPLPPVPPLPADDGGEGDTADGDRDGAEDRAEEPGGSGTGEPAADGGAPDDADDEADDDAAPDDDGADGTGGEPTTPAPAAVAPLTAGDLGGAEGQATDDGGDGEAE